MGCYGCGCKKTVFCQSCGMPMKKESDCGTQKDGSKSCDYCFYCFVDGSFTEPELTKEGMVKKVVGIMKKMDISDDKIEACKNIIPTLKRWKTK
jgi:hypothetical protein